MAITVNGAILRNMPEQISKNVEDIADLQATSENYGTRITALENSTILAATFEDCTFTGTTEVQGDLNQTSGDLAVTNNATIGGTLGVTGTVTASNDLDVGGDLSVGVDASVAGDLAVTGAITGGSIIENMSGYSFTAGNTADVTYTYKYASVCKNGNKVTFIIGVVVNLDAGYSGSGFRIGDFSVPSAIYNAINPVTIAGAPFIYMNSTTAIRVSNATPVSIDEYAQKIASNTVRCAISTSSLAVSTDYYIRVEHTILLSDNMAP